MTNQFSGFDLLTRLAAEDAAEVRRFALETPLVELSWLATDRRRVFAKLECLQRGGSFKIRGAHNAARKLPAGTPVVTASAGNHGLALTLAAERQGLPVHVFVPVTASEIKLRRLRSAGARVIPVGLDVSEARDAARADARRLGGVYVSPFDHPDVVAGQASLAHEIADQRDRPFDHLLLPFGGGGLLCGFGVAARQLWPRARLHGLLPSVFERRLDGPFEGREMLRPVLPTLADGLAIQHEPDNWLWPVLRLLQPQFHAVGENAIRAAMFTLLHQESLLVEGAGAIGLAPLLADPEDQADTRSPAADAAEAADAALAGLAAPGSTAAGLEGDILLLISGGNVSVPQLAKVFATGMAEPRLRKLNGLRASTLAGELAVERSDAPSLATDGEPQAPAPSTAGDTAPTPIKPTPVKLAPITPAPLEDPSAGDEMAELWLRLVDHIAAGLTTLEAVLAKHFAFRRSDGLEDDPESRRFVEQAVATTRRMIAACREPGLGARQIAGRYRLLVQQFALARTALSWCSASSDQSDTVMFFDPAELSGGGVNYDRYGSADLAALERRVLAALGLDDGQRLALLTSSGQAAYATIESFLLREVLPADGPGRMRAARVPYLYFEAMEQLQALPGVITTIADDWSVTALVAAVESSDSRVIHADPLGNIAALPAFDFAGLAKALEGRDWSHRWLVVDGTMISGGINLFKLFDGPHHPKLLYFESGSKYLQLGLDLQMAGVIVCREHHGADLARHRRNLGAGLYQCQVARYPLFDRADLVARLTRLTRNAGLLAAALRRIDHPRSRLEVAFPDHWQALGWGHGGGVVAVTFADPGLNNRPCLEGLIEALLQRCRGERIAMTKGVSFGFGTTRVSAAAAIAETTDPFLRFSLGEETTQQMDRLVACVTRTITEYLDAF